ncbi:MAG: hypothetical protein FJZ43_03845 [Candidatus Staskawiczbacteria bacterium]|nr:hypothetical protein [Candidatus Staskawiczbacteria bacterium]
MNNNIVIPLNEKSEAVLLDIIKKHRLEETDEKAFEKVRAHKLFNDGATLKLVRDLLSEKINNIQFFDALQSELGISKEATKNLAIDIMQKLVPLLEKIPEDKLQEYNRKKRDDIERREDEKRIIEATKLKKSSQELLLEKLKGLIPDDDFDKKELEKPYEVKKVEVKDVEEVAKRIKEQREKSGHIGTTGGDLQRKGQSDKYREPAE